MPLLINLILFVVATSGLTLILVRGSIFSSIRKVGPKNWQELTDCSQCAGFWVGALFFIAASYHSLGFDFNSFLLGVAYGGATSIFALGSDLVIQNFKLRSQRLNEQKGT